MAHYDSPEALSRICHRLVSRGGQSQRLGVVSCPLGPVHTGATPPKLSLHGLPRQGLKSQALTPCSEGA